MKKLPKTVFVKRVIDGDTEYLEADEDKGKLWDAFDEWTIVGEYKLIRTTKIKANIIEKPKS